MSEVIHYTGKIKLIEKFSNETLEEQCKRILIQHKYAELPSYCNSYIEMLYEKLYDDYVIVNGNLYKTIEKNEKVYNTDIFNISKNKDGSYDFEVMFCDDGCSFGEAIEIVLNNMNE